MGRMVFVFALLDTRAVMAMRVGKGECLRTPRQLGTETLTTAVRYPSGIRQVCQGDTYPTEPPHHVHALLTTILITHSRIILHPQSQHPHTLTSRHVNSQFPFPSNPIPIPSPPHTTNRQPTRDRHPHLFALAQPPSPPSPLPGAASARQGLW